MVDYDNDNDDGENDGDNDYEDDGENDDNYDEDDDNDDGENGGDNDYRTRKGWPRKSYIDLLVEDMDLVVEDLPNTMRDRKILRARYNYANLGRIDEET